jgi:hypothetical protein
MLNEIILQYLLLGVFQEPEYLILRRNNIYRYFIYKNTQENFTPRLNLFVRPHLRNMRINYETFANKYDSNFIIISFYLQNQMIRFFIII